ncbi:MAG: rRNA maturation RNase YbeY [Clostridia bacterium]
MLIVANEQNQEINCLPKLEKLAEIILNSEGETHELEISLSFVDNQSMQLLNKEYRGMDSPTDVLSFALREGDEQLISPTEGPELIGDIIISVERAISQAAEYDHSLERELCFLFTHGLLHLLGYDHLNSHEEAIMLAKQELYLQQLQISR